MQELQQVGRCHLLHVHHQPSCIVMSTSYILLSTSLDIFTGKLGNTI